MKIMNVIQATAGVIFLVGATVANAEVTQPDNVENAVLKHVVVGKKTFDVTTFNRLPTGKYESRRFYPTSDYYVLWHGSDMNAYEFLNITGMASKKTIERRGGVFYAGDMNDLDSPLEALTLGRVVSMLQNRNKVNIPVRKTMYVGYDKGVANAFRVGCKNKVENIVLAGGGIYDDESCSLKDTKLMYSYNDGDNVFPVDREVAFIDGDSKVLTKRLDASETEGKLISLMNCTATPSVMKAYGNTRRSYSCGSGNTLDVIEYRSSDHQWNGYEVALDGEYDQFGAPNPVKLTNWISDIFGMS